MCGVGVERGGLEVDGVERCNVPNGSMGSGGMVNQSVTISGNCVKYTVSVPKSGAKPMSAS